MKISNLALRFIGLAFLAMLLMNFPLLSTSNQHSTAAGIPPLYKYVFIVWLLIIALGFYFSNKSKQDTKNE